MPQTHSGGSAEGCPGVQRHEGSEGESGGRPDFQPRHQDVAGIMNMHGVGDVDVVDRKRRMCVCVCV